MFDNKFGLFIHWGLFSMTGLQEQAFARYDLNREEYEKQAQFFNPQNYNPEEWVLLAKKSGMKYICFTAKHHDGFCMWDTQYTDFNIMNTPYGKDVLKLLADACRKHGVLLSIYYSNPDWHHPEAYNEKSSHQWKAWMKENNDFAAYREYIKNQITELLTNYGEIYTLFWDIPPVMQDKSINELARKLQPNIFINDRGFDAGDFSTPEREFDDVPKCVRFTRMTEACNSVGKQSWGYRIDEDFYSMRHLTYSIATIMAKGGSYLLNVGPKPDGTIDEKSLTSLTKVGDWYVRMKGCLESHETDTSYPYELWEWDYLVNRKDGKSYFYFVGGLNSSAVLFTKFPCLPKKVVLVNTGEMLQYEIAKIPQFIGDDGKIYCDTLRIHAIPIDELQNEPVVLEIEW